MQAGMVSSDLGFLRTEGLSHGNQVARDLHLLAEIRQGDDRHVADEHQLVVVRVLQHSHVGKQALGGQEPGFLVQDAAEELVGGAEALHEHVALSVVHHTHGLGHSLQLVLDVHDREARGVDPALCAGLTDHVFVSNEGHVHDAEFQGPVGSLDGVAVDGPGGYHPLADTLRLKLGEKLVKRLYHWLSVVC